MLDKDKTIHGGQSADVMNLLSLAVCWLQRALFFRSCRLAFTAAPPTPLCQVFLKESFKVKSKNLKMVACLNA